MKVEHKTVHFIQARITRIKKLESIINIETSGKGLKKRGKDRGEQAVLGMIDYTAKYQ